MTTLAMLVRNEATVIRRCLESVRPLLSSWLVVDTGSTDGTQDLVCEFLADIPGQLVERPWVSFGVNRTEALRLAGEAGHPVLMLDADMSVRGSGLPSFPFDAGMVTVEDGSLAYRLPLLLRPGLPWRYVGAVHEYLDCDHPFTRTDFDGLVVVHHADRRNRQAKFLRDREVLKSELERNPADLRNTYYLAQTEHCLGNDHEAIRLYARRAEMGGWEEEAWYAAYQRGVLLLRHDPQTGIAALLQAWQRRPTRAEPLHDLAKHYRERHEYHLTLLFSTRALAIPLPSDTLFVHREVYAWSSLMEWSIAAAWLGDLEGARQANQRLLALDLPANVRERVDLNDAWCASKMTSNPITRLVDAFGNQTLLSFDQAGQPSTITEPRGNLSSGRASKATNGEQKARQAGRGPKQGKRRHHA